MLKAISYLGLNEKSIKTATILSPKEAFALNNKDDPVTSPIKFTHIVLATNLNLEEILELTVPKLIAGGKLSIYSRSINALERVADLLFKSRLFIDVQIFDTFTRKMQVLPSRTHPKMSGNLYSGFILTAYKMHKLESQTEQFSIEDGIVGNKRAP